MWAGWSWVDYGDYFKVESMKHWSECLETRLSRKICTLSLIIRLVVGRKAIHLVFCTLL